MMNPLNMVEARLGGGGTEKCTTNIDTPMPESLHDEITALASMAGCTKAEYVRRVLEIHARGALAFTRARMGQ